MIFPKRYPLKNILTGINKRAGIILFLACTLLYAQDNSDCLMCHEEESLTATVNSKKVSAFVDEKAFENSVHKDLDCVTCHVDGFDAPPQCETCQDEDMSYPNDLPVERVNE